MKSAYIAGPLTAEAPEKENENIRKAERVDKLYYEQGYAVYCPHTQTFTDTTVTYEQWMANDLYWLEKCDAVAFLPGWENSKGASIEHMVAKALGKEIKYWGDAERVRLPEIPTERKCGCGRWDKAT